MYISIFPFLYNYILQSTDYLKEINNYFSSNALKTSELKETFKDSYFDLVWDAIYVDEAQDCSFEEQMLFFNWVSKENVHVAIGTNQLTRNYNKVDWIYSTGLNALKLKNSLRQKRNLTLFNKLLMDELGYVNDIRVNDRFSGGKIIVIMNNFNSDKIIYKTLNQHKSLGANLYDILILSSNNFTNESSDVFRKLECEVSIFDGSKESITNDFIRDEARYFFYESSRGLEGWTVFCLHLDTFFDRKWHIFDESMIQNPYLTREEKRSQFVRNWLEIAITRAIDTLVITLDSVDSRLSRTLISLAYKNPDLIELRVNHE